MSLIVADSTPRYSPKAIVFCLARWNDFRKSKQHYLLYDFCYWANAALLLYLWVLPHSAILFQIVFLAANGPLVTAAPAPEPQISIVLR